jgi:hypothetical protein
MGKQVGNADGDCAYSDENDGKPVRILLHEGCLSHPEASFRMG